mmetsp:Transcript_28032/g.79921  ORF Transcript_28032/g.79921 Transcript_28032/m.79921 type:complete len:218 (+) Transcript_28032:594-1247(+)
MPRQTSSTTLLSARSLSCSCKRLTSPLARLALRSCHPADAWAALPAAVPGRAAASRCRNRSPWRALAPASGSGTAAPEPSCRSCASACIWSNNESARHTSALPRLAARCCGVSPPWLTNSEVLSALSLACMRSSRRRAHSALPPSAAQWSAEFSWSSVTKGSARARSRESTERGCPSAAAAARSVSWFWCSSLRRFSTTASSVEAVPSAAAWSECCA